MASGDSDTFEKVFDAKKGRDVKKWNWELHLLGTGAQAVIPPSIHPDTNKPYTWLREFDAFDFELGCMVTVPSADVEKLMSFETMGESDPRKLKPMELELAEMREYLEDICSDPTSFDEWVEDRDGWYRMGIAIHFQTSGSTEGFDLWCEISSQSEKFDKAYARRTWKSFKGVDESAGRNPVTFKSIVGAADEIRFDRDFDDLGVEEEYLDDLGPMVNAKSLKEETDEDSTEEQSEFEDFGEEEGSEWASDPFADLLGDPAGSKPNKKAPSEGDDDDDVKIPKRLAEMNTRHAFLRQNGSSHIMDFDPKDDTLLGFGSTSDFHALYKNDLIKKGNGKVQLSEAWISSVHRRIIRGFESNPPGYNNPHKNVDPEIHNISANVWSVVGKPDASCELFLWHVKHILCKGNEDNYDYLIKWFAHMVQKPNEKPGVAVVVTGEKGVGKDTPFEYFGKLCKNHYNTIGDGTQLYSKFNKIFQNSLLIHMQEGSWGGDVKQGGKLKFKITSTKETCEPKGVDSYVVDSFMRLFISSNDEWVVPATRNDRRYFVLEASTRKMQDIAHFRALRNEMNGDGPGALIHYLSEMDLTGFDVFVAPDTDSLVKQQLEGLRYQELFLYQVLDNGEIPDTQETRNEGMHYWDKDGLKITKEKLSNIYMSWAKATPHE